MIGWMQKKQKYFIVVIWISTISFIGVGVVGWGAYSYRSNDKVVASVGNTEITTEEFYKKYLNIEQNIKKNNPKITTNDLIKQNIPKKVLDTIIINTIIKNLAKELHIKVTDKEIAKWIVSNPSFQIKQSDSSYSIVKNYTATKKPKFSKEKYFSILKANGYNSQDFEQDVIKPTILINKTKYIISFNSSYDVINTLSTAIKIDKNISFNYVKNNSKFLNIKVPLTTYKDIYKKNLKNLFTGLNINAKIYKIDKKTTIDKIKKGKIKGKTIVVNRLNNINLYKKIAKLNIGSIVKYKQNGIPYILKVINHTAGKTLTFKEALPKIKAKIKSENSLKIVKKILNKDIKTGNFKNKNIVINVSSKNIMEKIKITLTENNIANNKILQMGTKYSIIKLKSGYLSVKINNQTIKKGDLSPLYLAKIANIKNQHETDKFIKYLMQTRYKTNIKIDINSLVKNNLN